MQTVISMLCNTGVKILLALVILLICHRLITSLVKYLKEGPLLDKLDPSLKSFIVSFARILLYILLVLAIIEILGLPTAGFITMLASCSVAVGLSLQGALSNLAGGLILLFFKPFKVGDYVDAGGHSGTVTGITVFYTTLKTVDNKKVVVPNGSLTGAAVVNYSAEPQRRVDLVFTASYDADIEKVKKVIGNVIDEEAHILKGAEAPDQPFVRLSAQKDSALEYTVRVWCKAEDYWTVYFNLNENVKKAFDAAGIEIPFPQIVVHNG